MTIKICDACGKQISGNITYNLHNDLGPSEPSPKHMLSFDVCEECYDKIETSIMVMCNLKKEW